MPRMTLQIEALDQVLPAVEAAATAVDANGTFPRQSVGALGDAGLLGLVSATAMGGQGAGMRDAAVVVERLAGACASTAMVTVMHYCATAGLEGHGAEAGGRGVAAGPRPF